MAIPENTHCPEPDRFQQALEGRLTAPELEQLACHLETCPACQDRVPAPAADRLGELLRRGGAGLEDTLLPVEVTGLIDRLLRLPRPAETQDATPHDVATPSSDIDEPVVGTREPGLEPPRQSDELGRLGPYRVLEVLGAGGMGLVYRAEDVRLQRLVALKVMRPELAARPGARDRFLREARAMAALEHERIVPIYQADEVAVGSATVPYLAMPLLRGESLAARLRHREPVPLADGLRIGRQVAEGLAAAHAAGLIHRDVKPANIWLELRPRDRETGSPSACLDIQAKLLDFGLARAADGESGLSATGQLLGTPAYMAPEQAEGRPVDARADLFSLGCVLYELVTGQVPFAGPSTMAILRQLAVHQPLPASQLNPRVPAALSDLIDRLLAKDPAGRPSSARTLADRLAEAERALEADRSLPTTTFRPAEPDLSRAVAPSGLVREPAAGPVARAEKTAGPAHFGGRNRKRGWALVGAALKGQWWKVYFALFLAVGLAGVGYLGLHSTRLASSSAVEDSILLQEERLRSAPPEHPLTGSIDVRLFEPDNPARQNLFLEDAGALPLKPGDEFCVEAELSRPAYVYVLWIDTEGNVQPVYPWRPGHWESRPPHEEPVQRLRRPEQLDRFYKISRGPPGMETLVLLARETPLPREVDLRAELGDLPQPRAQNLQAAAWFHNGVPVRNRRNRAGSFDETQRDDPVLVTQEHIRARLGKYFPYTLAVSFANRGR
jgi:serine/threonine protein kinase